MFRRTLQAAWIAGAIALSAGPSAAAYHSYRVTVPGGTSLDFRSTPSWVSVPEAHGVYMVRDDMRPGTDYFRYRGGYYVYSGGHWYRANKWNGRYARVNNNRVPQAFYSVRQDRWRVYPQGWDRRDRG